MNLRNQLLDIPETGMGYQIIRGLNETTRSTKRYVVYNAELIVDLDNDFDANRRKIISEGYLSIKQKAPYLELSRIRLDLQSSVKELRSINELKKKTKGRASGGSGAIDNPKENANGSEIFVRLSAYEDDKRIDFVNMKLKNGSYTTTSNDYLACKNNNDDPVDRYALPNNENIRWVFSIRPKVNDKLQRGIVQPAFGHDGGGIEVYFEDGTSNGTYINKSSY